jgi:pimeloyl-ACP methyl ester carboxylesterase
LLLLFFLSLPFLLLLGSAVWHFFQSKRDLIRFPPPGRIQHTSAGDMHMMDSGCGSIPVVLEAGIGSSSLIWATVEPELSRLTRVISYDRLGYGFSDDAKSDRTCRALVEELREALREAKAPSPRILVGHSFGGMLMRVYAGMYPREVAGLVLVDALDPAEFFPLPPQRELMLRRGAAMARGAAWAARLGIVRLGLHLLQRGREGAARGMAGLFGPHHLAMAENLVGRLSLLPRQLWPLMYMQWSRERGYRTMAAYLEMLPACCAQAALVTDLGMLPVIVVAGQLRRPGHLDSQRRMAGLSLLGRVEALEDASHWVQLERPDAVVSAVKSLL